MNRRLSTGLLGVGTLALAIVVMLVSPLLLQLIGNLFPVDWSALSDVGQSYTGVATLLSVGALSTVAYSIIVQARQGREQMQSAVRSIQFDLLKISIESRHLAGLMSGVQRELSEARFETYQRQTYTMLWFRYSQLSFISGTIAEPTLREALINDLFQIEEFRSRWRQLAPSWQAEAADVSSRRFVKIVEECLVVAEKLS